jgi:hypothetical protein
LIHDVSVGVAVDSLIKADLLSHRRWEVGAVREETGGRTSATGAAGGPILPGGTLVCRSVE